MLTRSWKLTSLLLSLWRNISTSFRFANSSVTSVTASWAPPRSHLHPVCCRNEVLYLRISAPGALAHSQAAGRCSTRASCSEEAEPRLSTASLVRPPSGPAGDPEGPYDPRSANPPGRCREDAGPPRRAGPGDRNALPKFGTWKNHREHRMTETGHISVTFIQSYSDI